MSLKQFQTNPELEKSGIVIDYGDFRIKIARAGGNNKRFAKIMDAKTKPFRRAIQTETMDNEKAMDLVREGYAEAVVLDWETKVDGKFKQGIEDLENEGKLIEVTPTNIFKTFKALPDLFTEIQEQAQKAALFRTELKEADAKN